MTPPKNTKDICAFIGMVKYYSDMWVRKSQLLSPLKSLTSPKVKFKWTDVEQKLFDYIKRTVSHNTLIVYPDFNKRLDIYADASDSQFGEVIRQYGKPIALYSYKITENQTRYTVTEKELLSIVKTLKLFARFC